MTSLLLALVAAYGAYLAVTAVALGWTGVAPGPARPRRRRRSLQDWMAQAGLAEVSAQEFLAVVVGLLVLATTLGFLVFGGVVPALVLGIFAATTPVAVYRRRRDVRREVAQEAWPRLIEEIRLLTGTVGRSIPQALLDVGRRGPEELRGAFEAAQREWLLSTDFARTVAVLKDQLADPTADAALETLLVAHEVGGADLDRRLDALADDRRIDTNGRKDARSKQAGVRFARRFVIIVPGGMAAVGLTIGNGRAAYATAQGQLLVAVGIGLVVACWVWSSRIMRLPEERRVFQ